MPQKQRERERERELREKKRECEGEYQAHIQFFFINSVMNTKDEIANKKR